MVTYDVLRRRLECFRTCFDGLGIEGFILLRREYVQNQNCLYLSGFSGSTADLIVTKDHAILFVDDRYTEQAASEAPCFEIVRYERPTMPKVAQAIKELGVTKIGYEAAWITVRDLSELQSNLGKEVQLIQTFNVIEQLRARKDPEELVLLKEAGRITCQAYDHILKMLKPGVTELELAIELEHYMRTLGASGVAFETILVSGARTSWQHGRPSARAIQNGEFVLLDFGAVYQHYCSDMTRTVCLGQPDTKQKQIYEIVRQAQEWALENLRAGVNARDVVRGVSTILEDAGYGPCHGIGHGVGLEVHEQPYLRDSEDLWLEEGHVVTVEPGIYIPGWGGVRIEDTVVIRKDGCESLTPALKNLLTL
jgi:Xaa-Pro aminopeptidase